MAVEYGNQRRGEFKQNLCKMSIENVYVKILWRGSKRGKLLYTSSCVSSPPTIVLNLLIIPIAG